MIQTWHGRKSKIKLIQEESMSCRLTHRFILTRFLYCWVFLLFQDLVGLNWKCKWTFNHQYSTAKWQRGYVRFHLYGVWCHLCYAKKILYSIIAIIIDLEGDKVRVYFDLKENLSRSMKKIKDPQSLWTFQA